MFLIREKEKMNLLHLKIAGMLIPEVWSAYDYNDAFILAEIITELCK